MILEAPAMNPTADISASEPFGLAAAGVTKCTFDAILPASAV